MAWRVYFCQYISVIMIMNQVEELVAVIARRVGAAASGLAMAATH
jgi:hypothetical protein